MEPLTRAQIQAIQIAAIQEKKERDAADRREWIASNIQRVYQGVLLTAKSGEDTCANEVVVWIECQCKDTAALQEILEGVQALFPDCTVQLARNDFAIQVSWAS